MPNMIHAGTVTISHRKVRWARCKHCHWHRDRAPTIGQLVTWARVHAECTGHAVTVHDATTATLTAPKPVRR